MKPIEGKINLSSLRVQPHNIIFSHTSSRDYEMQRIILLEKLDFLEDEGYEYLLLEGGHCSCYNFDETQWDGTLYTSEELEKLANADYNEDHPFWQMVKEY